MAGPSGTSSAFANLKLTAVRLTGATAKYKGGAVFVGHNSHVVVRDSHIEKARAAMGGSATDMMSGT